MPAVLVPTNQTVGDLSARTTSLTMRLSPAPCPVCVYVLQGVDKKGNPIMYDLEGPINFSVFPGLQVHT